MELWISIYHANYEPDPSCGLAIISSKNAIESFDVKFQKLCDFELKAKGLGGGIAVRNIGSILLTYQMQEGNDGPSSFT